MKWFIIIILALVLLLAVMLVKPGIAEGFTPSENVSLSFADNLTIETGNITISGLEASITNAAEAAADVLADNQTTLFYEFITLLIAALITALAFWKPNVFIYCLAAVVDLIYGLSLATSATAASARWVEGVVIAVVGIFLIFRVAIDAFTRARKVE